MQAQVRLAIGYIFNLSLLCSCATVDKAQIKQIRSLAIIGVDGRIVEDGSQLSQHLTALNDQQFGLRMYQALIAQMQQHMKWKFVSLDKVKAAKTMQKAVSEKVNSILTAISMKDKFITIPGILQPTYAGYKLNDRNWRKKIMQELKVDSLLFLSFEVRQELPWYAPGFAQSLLSSATFNVHMLRCQLRISAFNSKGDDPIWKTGLEDGGQSENPSFKVYGIAFPDIKQAAVMSSCSRALDQHLARLN